MHAGMGGPITIHNQHSFIGRNDDGVESLTEANGGATDIAPLNTNFSQLVDVTFRLRIMMTMQTNEVRNRQVRLRRNINGSGYVLVNLLNTVVQITGTAFYGHQTDSTEAIIGPPPPGPPSVWIWADNSNGHRVDGGPNTDNANYGLISTGWYMSAEFSMKIIGDDVNNGDTIQFRIQRVNGVLLDNYLITPTITVIKPLVLGPLRAVAAQIHSGGGDKHQVHSGGAIRSQGFVGGAIIGEQFAGGMVKGEVQAGGADVGDTFAGRAIKGQLFEGGANEHEAHAGGAINSQGFQGGADEHDAHAGGAPAGDVHEGGGDAGEVIEDHH